MNYEKHKMELNSEKQELQVRAESWGVGDFVPKNESNHENTNGSAILQG
jgi:hypothetical protein